MVGALVSAIAFFGPTAVLMFVVARLWERLEKWRWRPSIQEGLAPVSIGLLLAGCFTMARGAATGFDTATITVTALLMLLQYNINPALLILGSGIIGAFIFGPK